MKHAIHLPAIFTLLSTLIALAPVAAQQDKPLVIDVFPGKIPGATGEPRPDKITGTKPNRRVTEVTRPTLTVFRPAKNLDTGTAIVIAPGGGYSQLALDHEGDDVATWLNSLGVTGLVLHYRIPTAKGQSRDDISFPARQDAQRAISLVRAKAKEWGINPKRIGMLGFSAGGHLTAMTATSFDKRGYEEIDEIDKVSCRPDFAVMLYPAYLVQGGKLLAAVKVTKESPPAFFAHCGDDMYTSEASALMYLALKRAGVPAELHIYPTGGHGFGMRPGKLPVSQWPKRCEEWMRSQGLLGGG